MTTPQMDALDDARRADDVPTTQPIDAARAQLAATRDAAVAALYAKRHERDEANAAIRELVEQVATLDRVLKSFTPRTRKGGKS